MFRLSTSISQTIKQHGIKPRPNGDPGVWLMFLLPLAIIVSYLKHPRETSQLYRMCLVVSVGLLGTSVIFIVQCARRKPLNIVRTLHLIPAAFTATLCRVLLQSSLVFSLINGLISSVCYWHLLLFIFHKFPHSFTVGEVSITVQGLILLLYSTAINLYISLIRPPTKVLEISTLIIQVGLCAIGLICFLAHKFKSLRKPTPFYLMSTFVLSSFIILMLHLVLRQSPLLWILLFLFEDVNRTQMVIYWGGCSVAAVIAINRQINTAQKATPAIRKVFHIFAVAVFLPGLIYQCSLIYLASGVVLGIFATLEICRVLNVPPLGTALQDGFVIYRDEKDTGLVALTPLYLLIGCALPLWIHPASCDILDSAGFNLLPVMSGVLAIGVGDTVAGVVGSAIGKHQWPGTKKTMEGTMGCIVSQLVVVYILILMGYIGINQNEVLKATVAIVTGSLVEASTTQVDNIVLPLILYILLV